ncbi:hypothetical protein D3C87_864660 [compost metagenome]
MYGVADVAAGNLISDIALIMGLPTGTWYPADIIGTVVTDDIDQWLKEIFQRSKMLIACHPPATICSEDFNRFVGQFKHHVVRIFQCRVL